MIYADPSENEVVSKLATVNVKISPHLEEITGADIIVTPLDLPFVPALVQQHIDAGALMVQRKTGMDLPSSIHDRMDTSLARMLELKPKQSQCILLFIGMMTCDSNGEGKIDGRPIIGYKENSYWMVQSAIEKWMERGGVYSNISRPGLLSDWLYMKERHVKHYHSNKSPHIVYKPTPQMTGIVKNDPLQELVLIKDWRCTLASIPGLGPKKIDVLYEELLKDGQPPTLIKALVWLTSWDIIKTLPGFGKVIYKNIRDWFGLEDMMSIDFDCSEPEVENVTD